MGRTKICEHLYSCAFDGGTPEGCDVDPCRECGALCPGSTWTPERAYARVDEVHAEYVRLVNETGKQVFLYRKWKRDQIRSEVVSDVIEYVDGDAENGPRTNHGITEADIEAEVSRRLASDEDPFEGLDVPFTDQ